MTLVDADCIDAELAAAGTTAPPPPAHAAQACGHDQTREERIAALYLHQLAELLDHANRTGSTAALVHALTFTLARVIVALDSALVTADILSRLGEHVNAIAETRDARRELEANRRKGVPAH